MGAAPRIALMALAMGLTIYLPYFRFDAVASRTDRLVVVQYVRRLTIPVLDFQYLNNC